MSLETTIERLEVIREVRQKLWKLHMDPQSGFQGTDHDFKRAYEILNVAELKAAAAAFDELRREKQL